MESSKRDDPAAAFFGNMTPAPETAVCDVDVDDDDDNYYVDDGFENGDGVDNDDDDDDDDNEDADDDADDDDDDNERCGKESTELLGSIEPTEPTEPTGPTSELTENTYSARYFQGDTTDKSNTNTSNASNNNVVVFGNFNLCAEGNYEGDDGASESGSDFESFEGTSSQFDVVVAVKPDKNKVNEQEQARQQQQQQQTQQQQQKQHHHNIKKEQQQQQRQNKELKEQHEALEQHKQNKQQVLRLQHLQLQQQDFQHHKSLRERAENYDTHIQQQQQLLQQQACEESQLRKHAQSSANDKNSTEQIFQKSRELQKQLENQLDEHQLYISAQQEQRRLHQKHLKEQQTFEREEQFNLREHQKQQQQIQQQLELQQHKQAPMPPPKPVTRKQIQSQTQQQIRSAISSRHSSRASSSHPPSSRASPLLATSRGRVTSRAKGTTSRPHSQGDKINVLKKRRNPLNSPPPAPSVTPNSARTPRSRTAISSTDIGDVTRNLVSPSLKSYTNDVCFAASNGGGGASGRYGGGDADAIITPDSSLSQMFRMCSKLKPDFIDMLVPLANAFNIVGSDVGKDEQRSPRTSRRSKAPTTQMSEASANHDLIEALTNCLFKLGSAEKENIRKVGKDNEATQEEGVKVQNGDSPKSLTLYTGESPYEKMKSKKSQHLQKYKSKITQKGICKDSHKVQPNDWQNESFAGENDNINCAESDYQTQINTENNANLKPITSPCTLWNANLKPAPQKKDLHIEDLIAERDHFLRLCSKNRFYTNPNFNQPWSVFSKLAARLSNDIVSMIEEDFSIGVSKFVQDFLDNETKI